MAGEQGSSGGQARPGRRIQFPVPTRFGRRTGEVRNPNWREIPRSRKGSVADSDFERSEASPSTHEQGDRPSVAPAGGTAPVQAVPWKRRTRHPRPGLRALIDTARHGPPSRDALGPRRAIVQCHHPGGPRYPIAEVRGEVIVVNGMPGTAVVGQPHSLRATYAVQAPCSHCPPGQRDRLLELPKIRLALRQSPGGSPLKLDADVVAPRTPPAAQ